MWRTNQFEASEGKFPQLVELAHLSREANDGVVGKIECVQFSHLTDTLRDLLEVVVRENESSEKRTDKLRATRAFTMWSGIRIGSCGWRGTNSGCCITWITSCTATVSDSRLGPKEIDNFQVTVAHLQNGQVEKVDVPPM